jgi:hypothetical protein
MKFPLPGILEFVIHLIRETDTVISPGIMNYTDEELRNLIDNRQPK